MKIGKNTNAIIIFIGAIFAISCIIGTASAHFTMLFPGGSPDVSPDDYLANIGEEKTVLITWGCPFKELFDCIDIPEVHVRDPDGNITQLTPVETSVDGVKAYNVSFRIDKRGDHIVYATMNVSGIKGDFIDHSKTIIHSGQAVWKGWDAKLGENVEIIPYIRPYGLEEGFVFKAKALQDQKPLKNTTVYFVKYRMSEDPDVLEKAENIYPQDSWMMVKGLTKTDEDGDFIYTLDEPGVWTICVFGKGIMERSIFILPVFESFPPAAAEDLTPVQNQDTTSKSPAPGSFMIAGIFGAIAVLLKKKRYGRIK